MLLSKNIFEVQAIIDILGVMVNSGIGWNDIQRMVKEEQKQGNILANMIHKMNFDKNYITLLLDSVNEDEEDGSSVDDQA